MKAKLTAAALAAVTMLYVLPSVAADKVKPFVLVAPPPAGTDAAGAVKDTLRKAGFEVAGEYRPYPDATIVVVTNDTLKRAAAASKHGGYGAGMRVAITRVGGTVQVSYTEPRYIAAAYRMKGDLADVSKQLATALGSGTPFGPDEGMTEADLRDYRYMFGMEHFTDPNVLAEYKTHEAAVAAVEKGLAEGRRGVTKVYRIDIPGKQETVFGVAMDGKKGGDKEQDDAYIMSQIDFKATRSTAHLPYEILVSGGTVLALSARFRIAINFPDLSMMGSNSFMSIMGAPDAIKGALTAVAGGPPG